MRLRHIEVFHAVYISGSITGAAKLLNVSQPSVSKVLAHAEQQLGFLLFERQKGKIVPTREADHMIDHVNDVYKNIHKLRQIAKNLGSAETGLIRIAMAPAFGIDLIPAAIASYLEQYPNTMFKIESLHQHQVVRALKEFRVDFGLVFDPPTTPGIRIDHLATAKLVALTRKSPESDGNSTLTLEDLACMPFIKLSRRSPLGQLLANNIENSGIEFRTVATVETYHMAKALVAHGAGVALIDEITARSAGHTNVVARHLEPSMQFNVAILHAESNPFSVLTQQFISHLRTETNTFLQAPLIKHV